ncbi:thiamine pyrophosphate-binding protein [Lihuaxuella thermophila]|uniref:Pyruvate dehydrogenase (Quinone)/pyruvate oxidase n=1 Tax=Lihuaxuella thermophila TaxID=1173111 RepID=A0A1H8C5Y1_9BACL|nr:thiamine pyrophosphate-binding protein [Lihuaxuella thermophila]SEM90440.1 pyruvate dehydrogenase (quinone)/pyruvate oxidase [Lihuaxuella thermophila]
MEADGLNQVRTVTGHLVEQLTAWGVRRIYGVAGDANLYLLDELARQDKIRYISCRHETTAALMAAAEAKVTGKPAVCTATSGPGIALLLNGLADAYKDHVPVLAITGQVERPRLGIGGKQDIDQQRLMDPIALYTSLVVDPRAFPHQLNIAMKTAVSGGGVAHLSIPKDVWPLSLNAPIYSMPPQIPVMMPNKTDMVSVLDWINQAERPVLLVGRGVREAQEQVMKLAEKIQAPLMVTMPAKSYIPNDHPLFVGGLGQAGSEAATDLLKQSDLCIILGATWWPEDYVPKHVPTVQIDARWENIGRTHPNVASLAGDLSYLLGEMIYGVRAKENDRWLNEIRQKKENWTRRIEAEAGQNGFPLAPQRVMAAISRCLQRDAVIALDVGDHTLWFERIAELAGQEVLISGRWRTLGFGLPAAMAAQLVYPERQVVSIAGDGGFLTTAADLATVARYQLPITIFLINNGSYAMEKNRMKASGLQTLGSDLFNPDFVAFAQAFGVTGYRVERVEELEGAIRQALASKQPALVDIWCDDTIVPHTQM